MTETPSGPALEVEQAAQGGPLFVVMNARSGSRDAAQTQAEIGAVFEQAGREHHFLLPGQPWQISQTAREAVGLAGTHNGVVVAAGGDGTINAVAEAVLRSGRPFGVLPQGTFNYFARAHGIPLDTTGAASALLRASIEPAHVGLVNDRVFLVNASLGLYPELLEQREAFKKQFGRSRLVAMVSGLRTLLRERRQLRLSIEVEGEARSLVTPTLFISNNALQLQRLGFAEAADLASGHLAAIAVRPISSAQMLGLVLRGALGRLGEAEQVMSTSFRRLTVHTRSRRPVKVGVDGEIRQLPSPLIFSVAPERLMLLAPAAQDRVTVE